MCTEFYNLEQHGMGYKPCFLYAPTHNKQAVPVLLSCFFNKLIGKAQDCLIINFEVVDNNSGTM